MLEKWIIIISGAALSSFLYFVFVAIIYNMIIIQLRINNIYNSIMLLPFAKPTLWRLDVL